MTECVVSTYFSTHCCVMPRVTVEAEVGMEVGMEVKVGVGVEVGKWKYCRWKGSTDL